MNTPTLTLKEALLVEIAKKLSTNTVFSIYELTQEIRKHTNDSGGNYRVNSSAFHTWVKESFEELLPILNLTYTDNGTYRIFQGAAKTVAQLTAATLPTVTPVQPVNLQNAASVNNVVPVDAIKAYLNARGQRTIKQVQSALHGRANFTCNQIYNALYKAGLNIHPSNTGGISETVVSI